MHNAQYQNQGLEDAARRHGVSLSETEVMRELERINERGQLARLNQVYAEPVQPETRPVITLEMKQGGAAIGFVTFCIVCIHAAAQGAFTAALAVAGYGIAGAVAIGGGWMILKTCFSYTPSGGDCGNNAPGGSNQPINVTVNVAGNTVNTTTK